MRREFEKRRARPPRRLRLLRRQWRRRRDYRGPGQRTPFENCHYYAWLGMKRHMHKAAWLVPWNWLWRAERKGYRVWWRA